MTEPQTSSRPFGTLFLVATPIGNLEDITARALRILREADVIAAEDTRVTRKLLSRFDIHTPLTSYHAHSSDARESQLLSRLLAGESVALVSDAGTPCVSDPGAELVVAAIDAGVTVIPIPGPVAAIAALIGSGIAPGRFAFDGFLPRSNDRRERLAEIAAERRTVILYESSPRLVDTLDDLAKVCGPGRNVAVGRELTKTFESFVRGTLESVAAHYRETPPRGECVIVLGGAPDEFFAPEAVSPAERADEVLRESLKNGLSAKDASRAAATATGLARRDLYARAVELAEEIAG